MYLSARWYKIRQGSKDEQPLLYLICWFPKIGLASADSQSLWNKMGEYNVSDKESKLDWTIKVWVWTISFKKHTHTHKIACFQDLGIRPKELMKVKTRAKTLAYHHHWLSIDWKSKYVQLEQLCLLLLPQHERYHDYHQFLFSEKSFLHKASCPYCINYVNLWLPVIKYLTKKVSKIRS